MGASIAASVLLSADARGIDSHGISRLSGYVRLWEAGRINTNPDIKIVHETLSTATIDGDAGFGIVSSSGLPCRLPSARQEKWEQVG